ncbi:MAG: ABC transporter permease, partial [Thermoleophilaceae bacterium]
MSTPAWTAWRLAGTVRVKPGALLLIGLGLVIVAGLGSSGNAELDTGFQLSAVTSSLQLGEIVVPVRAATLACGAVVLAIGAYGAYALRGRRYPLPAVAAATAAATVAFLCWAAGGSTINVSSLAAATVTGALPLLLGALAGLLSERSGVINVAIEGQFLLGAFAASVAASLAGVWVGLVAGSLAGGLIGAMLALLAIRFLADQVIVGIVLNLLVLGLTGFLFSRVVIPNQDSLALPDTFDSLTVPGLAELPIVGPALFDQTVIPYLAVALLVAVHVTLRHTRWGLRTLAVGESPEAADSAGVSVLKIRYWNVIVGGLAAGIGGVYLTIGSVGAFGPNISSG